MFGHLCVEGSFTQTNRLQSGETVSFTRPLTSSAWLRAFLWRRAIHTDYIHIQIGD